MLKYYFSICIFIIAITLHAQKDEILMKVGDAAVTTSEFKYIYEKNNGSAADYSQKSIQEYLDLYKRFKLKVQKAKSMQLDTVPELKSELEGYRKQLAASYLIDKEVTDQLLMELYERTDFDIRFSHIFVNASENAPEDAKKNALIKIQKYKSELASGRPFDELAKESEDFTSAAKGGDMGYYTAKLPSGFYELENALYKTKVGEISDIVKTKIGYHIVKVTDKRPARGIMSVSHIMVGQHQKELADSIVYALRTGSDFVNLVQKYSIDKTSNKNGGKLPAFGLNTYDKTFEDAAFALTKDGEFSLPILTKSGWHIIKRDNKPSKDSYDVFVKKMKGQISTDSRFDKAKEILIGKIKAGTNFKAYPHAITNFISTLTDDFNTYKWKPADNLSNEPVLEVGENSYSLQNFADYVKSNTKIRLKYDASKPKSEVVDELFQAFTNEKALEYEEKALPSKYPDFKSLMREYEEGILLFEATRIHVWDKANQDTIGLEKFYSLNKSNYSWDEQAKLVEYRIHTSDKSVAEKVFKLAGKKDWDKIDAKFNKKGDSLVTMTSTLQERDGKLLEGLTFAANSMTNLQYDDQIKAFTFKKIENILPKKQKTLSEARGYVVADYQDSLEKQWVSDLEKEFPVVIYKDAVMNLIK
ncbi:MAG: peptidylprolyl isomerase [Saprospiraceae bacterium]